MQLGMRYDDAALDAILAAAWPKCDADIVVGLSYFGTEVSYPGYRRRSTAPGHTVVFVDVPVDTDQLMIWVDGTLTFWSSLIPQGVGIAGPYDIQFTFPLVYTRSR